MTEKISYGRQNRKSVQTVPSGESKTEQCHEGETNINKIMARYRRTGLVPQRGNPGFYGDFSSAEDYQTCCNKVLEANNNFMTLPADIRKHFENDPGKLLAFLSDDNNREEAYELGILPRPEPEQPAEPIAVRVIADPESPQSA